MTQACTSHCVPPRCPKVVQLPYKPEKDCHLRHLRAMAEGVRFELTDVVKRRQFSRLLQ